MPHFVNEKHDWISIERNRDGYAVYGHDEYEASSVLAGYPRRSFLDQFETLEEAQKAFPKAKVTGCTKQDIELPHTAPDWFDPMDAGERWDDDY